jgi:anti-sigma regulatory factor (Ser/Thr protein kinase)
MRDKTTLAQTDLARTWQQVFPGTPDQLRQVRAALRTFLDGCPATDDVALLITELAANAILHSASGGPGGTFTVRVWHAHGDHVRAEVRDQGSGWDGDIARSAIRPHGLCLLLALAAACGTDGSDRSRTVWFRLDDRVGRELS